VAKTAKSQSREPVCIEDVQSCAFFVRREMTVQHGIKSICFTRGLSGVIEFSSRSADWKSTARSAAVPEEALAKVFKSGASYAIFWKVLDAEYRAVTDYILPEWAEALRAERGKDETYVNKMTLARPAARIASNVQAIAIKHRHSMAHNTELAVTSATSTQWESSLYASLKHNMCQTFNLLR